ncbi:ABC transporter substrate-binding protein [Rhizobium sp. AU243]|uniref:ABC transporter substrate-binding protein n=1 Tax=Rhizobium sp. AU243 TaxID=2303425 RepID=UPI0010CB749F|nr:ABC transporter substrate-binding protein [Rhizobium sp. AU243]TKV70570.1 ABC transporter substrate-binding protein [Rhizobium sp. AU243]
MKFTNFAFACSVAVVSLLAISQAFAANITIGRAGEQVSIDPQFSRGGNNSMTSSHMFERLIAPDNKLQLQPELAESWMNTDPLTWEFKLRKGVKFHDGSDFTASDVVFSLERIKNIPNSPAPFTGAIGAIDTVEAVDSHTIRIKTKAPTPNFLEQICFVFIVSEKAATGATTQDFNSGKAAIGTGPYKFKEWVPGDRLVMTANTEYWGVKPKFETVNVKFISNAAARVAALLSGAVDLIDQVPSADLPRISEGGEYRVDSVTSPRMIFVAMDSDRDNSPFITDATGKPVDKNPLKDPRVRLAMSKMINRDLIVERVLGGSGTPAGQMVPEGIGGYNPDLPPTQPNLEEAKQLLTEAGYRNGFGLTVHSSNDRVPGDADVAQALGQMFARGGLKVNGVVTRPYNVYADEAGKREYSVFTFTFGTTTPSSATGLLNWIGTYNKEAGSGAFNRARYSNPKFDEALKAAMSEFDEQKRFQMLADAAKIAFDDVAVIPLYWQKIHWASKNGLSYDASMLEETTAMNVEITQ